jgi:hypothetical protein
MVNGHALFTVMLRPMASVDKAMAEDMEPQENLMTQLGGKDWDDDTGLLG